MIQNDSDNEQELVAASMLHDVEIMLTNAFVASGLSIKELAAILGVTGERVTQVLSFADEGNLHGDMRIATLARYMRAMGYTVSFKAVAAADGADANKVNKKRPYRAPRTPQGTLREVVYELLLSIAGNVGLPISDCFDVVRHAGYSTQDGVEFLAEEATRGRITISTEGLILAVR